MWKHVLNHIILLNYKKLYSFDLYHANLYKELIFILLNIVFSASTVTSDGPQILKLLCWNLDGLDTANLEERTAAVIENILLKKPDVVLLQEVVPLSLKIFQENAQG